MPRKPSIENHPQRAEIEAAVAAGESQRDVATRFGVSRSALQRHLSEIAKNPVAEAPPARSEPQSGVQAPPETPQAPPDDDAAGPAAPENNARGGGSTAGAGVADPATASRFVGSTDTRGGVFASKRRAVEYHNGVGEPVLIMPLLDPGRWADDVEMVGLGALDYYLGHEGLTSGAVLSHLAPRLDGKDPLEYLAREVMTGMDLSGDSWTLLVDDLRAVEPLQNAIAAAHAEAAAKEAEEKRQQELRRPRELKEFVSGQWVLFQAAGGDIRAAQKKMERAYEAMKAHSDRIRGYVTEALGGRDPDTLSDEELQRALHDYGISPGLAMIPLDRQFDRALQDRLDAEERRRASAAAAEQPPEPAPPAEPSVAPPMIRGLDPLPAFNGGDGEPMGP